MPTFSGLFADWVLDSGSAPALSLPQELPPSIASALSRRGITTPQALERYLYPTWEQLEDPFALPDIEPALDHLHTALKARQKIYVVGDYDVDGTTSAALLGHFFQKVGHTEFFLHIPNRFAEGYGVSDEAVNRALEGGYGLFLTVDCGTKDGARLARLQAAGVPVIVIDHHAVGPNDPFPPAVAFVSPQRPDARYPNRHLSASGVTFRFLSAYVQRYGLPEEWRRAWIQLAAVGLLADIMPLVGENRLLVQLGLQELAQQPLPGIAALMEQAGLAPPLRSRDVVFALAPRLNAPGRLKDPRHTLFLLLQHAPSARLEAVAKYLDALNRHRQRLQEQALGEALQQLEQQWPGLVEGKTPPPPALVVASPRWSKGIIGLVAAKLTERFHRPAVAFTQAEDGLWVGSARSPEGVPLYSLLEAHCKPYLVRFGGHDRAAGLSLSSAQLSAFAAALADAARSYLRPRPLEGLDALLPPDALTPELAQWRERFEPIGPGNPAPRFLIEGLRVVGIEEGKALLAQGGRLYEAQLLAGEAPTLAPALRLQRGKSVAIIATPRLQRNGAVSLRLRDVILPSS